ncbi:hypothetical protein BMS3Bbin04_00351 [bacterium BMS3Bbin04]|nr:hypothetical protein BMS3Bbin04_00351 [bacterium BMS3Bbin04]
MLKDTCQMTGIHPVGDEVRMQIPKLVHHQPETAHDQQPSDQTRFDDVLHGADKYL